MQSKQQHLLSLVFAKQNQEFQQIKKTFSEHTRYFFNVRRNITIVYDKPMLYIIHKQYLKIIELKKAYAITDLAYNYKKNAVLYFTTEGEFHVYFASTKSRYQIKKDFKKVFMLQWLYSAQEHASFFVATDDGIHLYRVYQQQKRSIKQIKHISGKYICYLYEPKNEFLVGFQYAECENAYLYHFQSQKIKSWFRNGQIQLKFTKDESMAQRIKSSKTLGLEGNRISKQLFHKKKINEDNFIDIQTLHNIPYLIFYFANEGKLQLSPLMEHQERKQLTIKLPSDSPPSVSIYDNMLVVHLKVERITFIYEISSNNFQPLVSPYPLSHENKELISQLYENQFVSTRALLPNGHISKWKISVPVIYSYLRVDLQIFEFLNRRTNCKIQAIKWMRQNLFRFKHIDLSRMWKSIFSKIESQSFDVNEIISMIEIYTNLFYTLSIEPNIDELKLANILLECLRQANEFRIIVPIELQYLAVKLLLNTSQIQLLIFLVHHGIIDNHQKCYELIFERGRQEGSDVLLALGIDMASQCASPKELLKLILISQRPKQAKRYIRMNFSKMEPQYMLDCAKHLNDQSKIKEFREFLSSFFTRKRLDIINSQTERKQPE